MVYLVGQNSGGLFISIKKNPREIYQISISKMINEGTVEVKL